MSNENYRVLVLNPGSTSTKFAVYTQSGAELVRTIRHGKEELAIFTGRPVISQLEYRGEMIEKALAEAGYAVKEFSAVGGRGGMLRPMKCGTYLVDEVMVDDLRHARYGDHASNMGALLALRFAQEAGVNAYIVDPTTVDEMQECARPTGSPLIKRMVVCHALNTKAVARRYAREQGCAYESLRLIVAHLGSGITVSAHQNGEMIDNNSIDDGPFGVDRCGGLPSRALIKLCFSGRFTEAQLDRHVFGDGGLFAYLGTRDLIEVENRIAAGDSQAELIYDAMIYKIAKIVGSMAVVLKGKVDALLLTGGMAHSEKLVKLLSSYVEWIAPIQVYPGEDELQALADGVFRVLNGEEQAKRLEA